MSRLTCLATALLLAACGPAASKPPARQSLGTATAATLSGELSSTAALATGLDTVWLTLTDDGAPVTDATLTLMPRMTMMDKQHACPVVGDVVAEDATQGLYRGQLVPQMASGDGDVWSLDVKIERPSKEPRTLTYPLTVTDSGLAKTFTVTGGAGASSMSVKYVMSVSFPSAPKVGQNAVVVTLHTMKDLLTFEPFDGATLEMVPQMPSMGHGSSNNVAPTLASPGRYQGTVSFSMLGEWRLDFTVKSGDTTLSTQSFSVTL
jgi:hypothetical protein